MNKKNIFLISFIFLLLLISACSQTPTGKVTGTETQREPIKIGYIGPLTGDGATLGETEVHSVELALEKINSEGGINGRKLEVIYEDGKCNGRDAATAAQKLVNVDKVKIILGGLCSGETLAAAPITEPSKVILFSSFSSNPAITTIGDYVFRNSPSDEDGGKEMAKLIYSDGIKKIAIISENTDYCLGLTKVTTEEYEKKGGKVVANEIFNADQKDYRTQLTKIKQSNPDGIIFVPQSVTSGALLVKQASELGLKMKYYRAVAYTSPDVLGQIGKAANGLRMIDAPGLGKKNEIGQNFLNEFNSKYGAPTHEYAAGAKYDATILIGNALRECGEDTDCIRDYLYSLENFKGTIGTYDFDENGDVKGINYAVKEVINAEKGEIIDLEIGEFD